MSEEKKIVELKDEELEKVSGGNSLDVPSNAYGTWFCCNKCHLNTYFSPNVNKVGQTETFSCPVCKEFTTMTGVSCQGKPKHDHGDI